MRSDQTGIDRPSPAEREADLLLRAGKGEAQAIDELLDMHAPRLYSQVVYPVLPERDEARDVLRESLVAAMQALPRFRPEGDKGIFPWLARIARNKALDRHRRRAGEGRALASYRHHLDALEGAPTPERLLRQAEEQQLLRRRTASAMGRINPRYARAIELRIMEGRERQSCAEELDVSLGTFDVLLHRALKAMKKVWDEETED